jgi:hypothetical protein
MTIPSERFDMPGGFATRRVVFARAVGLRKVAERLIAAANLSAYVEVRLWT